MPHFRVDDELDGHPKTERVGDDALGMWVRAGSWAMRYLTDGFMLLSQAALLRATAEEGSWRLRHVCEVCGRDEVLESEEAHRQGWDYPPRMGVFGIVSPRTCPDCPMTKTVWWAITCEKKTRLDPNQMKVVERIKDEPHSILVPEGNQE